MKEELNNGNWLKLTELIQKAAVEMPLNEWEKLIENAFFERDKAKHAELTSLKNTPTFKKLVEELNEHKNELVLVYDNVYRLAGVTVDERDYYWVMDDGKKVVWHSCVGGWIPLKKHLPKEEYESILNVWNLNNDINAQ
jgi:hypothetical protein